MNTAYFPEMTGSSTTASSGGANTVTIAKPAGTVAGDVLVACIVASTAYAYVDVTPPDSSWTVIRITNAQQSWYYDMVTYYKVAGANEPATYTWTSSYINTSGSITRLTGIDINRVVDASAESQGKGDTTSVIATAPSVTTTAANDVVIHFYGSYAALASPYFTEGSFSPILSPLYEWAPAYPGSGAYDPPSIAGYHWTKANAGSTGTRDCILTKRAGTPSVWWVAQTIAFKAAPTVGFQVATSNDVEGTTSRQVNLVLSSPSDGPVTVHYAVSGTASPTSDYTVTASPCVIPAGQTTGYLYIHSLPDELYENDETVVLTLTGATGAILGGNGTHTHTITNDDFPAPTPVIAAGDSRTGISPDTGTTFPIPSTAEVLQMYKPTGTTTGDFLLAAISWQSGAGSVINPPAGWTLIRSTYREGIRVATYYKIANSTDTSVTVYTFGMPATDIMSGWHATGGITRYTGVDIVTPIDVSGGAGGSVTYGNTIAAPSVFPNYTNSRIISVFGTHHPVENISTPAGMSERYEVHYHLDPNNSYYLIWPEIAVSDMNWPPATGTGEKLATVTGNNPTPIGSSSNWVAQTIALKTSRLSVSDVSVAEGNSSSANAIVTVSLDHPTNVPVTFNWLTADGTAVAHYPNQAGDDYMVSGGTNYTIPAGETSYELAIPILGDAVLESNETFHVNVTGVTGATVADSQGTVSILNDDSNITINDVSQNEGNTGTSNFNFTVTINPVCSLPVSVTYFIPASEGTATQGTDYAFTQGTLNMAAGQATGTIPVPVVGDTVFEPDETFVVYLSGATNAKITDNRGTGTILNDDAAPSFALTMGVSPSNSGSATDLTGTSPYAERASISISATPTTGYHFVNWTAPAGSFANANIASTTFTMPAQAVTVTANFAPDTYTVNFNSQGGSAVSNQTVTHGGLVVRPADPVRNGYTFAGWHKDADCSDDWVFDQDTVTSNITLYARWVGMTLHPMTGLVTTESGDMDTFTVVLNTQPTADVSVGLSSSDPTEGTASPVSLTFTTSNWNTPQTVTITGVDDDLVDGDIPYTISATGSSTDLGYHGLMNSVSVTNMDVEGTAPEISTHPVNQGVAYGDDALFASTATGTPSPTVQWQVSTDGGSSYSNIGDESVYSGTSTTTLRLVKPPVSYSGYKYRAVFTNGFAPDATTNAATLTVSQLNITGSLTAANKVYDGATGADVTGRDLTGVLSPDAVTLTGGTAVFADKNVGTGKTVTLSGASLTGADAGNYNLTSIADATADITPKPVAPAIVADDKTYNGTTAAILSSQTVSGLIGSDDVSLIVGLATFADKNVGTWTVTAATLSLSGADAGNYTLSESTASDKAEITALSLTISGAVAEDKMYDGDNIATVNFAGASLTGVMVGDVVSIDTQGSSATFDNANAGNDKQVTVTGVALDGADASNYTVSELTGLTADVTPRGITGIFTAEDKVYDGTMAAIVVDRSLTDVLSGDDVKLSGGTAAFEDKHAGTGKTVTLIGAILSGTDAGNYSLTSVADAVADILTRAIEVTAVAGTKTYDGTVASNQTPTITSTLGLAAGDSAIWTQTYDSKDAGVNKTLTPAGSVQDINGGANYNVTFVPVQTGVIEKAELTITADNKTSQYSDPRAPFTSVISGFVAGETPATGGVSGSPSYTTNPELDDPITQVPGSYSIIPAEGTLTANNYSFQFVNGTYAVTKEDGAITFDMHNPVSVKVITAGEGNAAFTWQARVSQANDGNPGALDCILKSNIHLSFSAVGNGGGWTGTATYFDPDTGIATFDIPADVLDVETYGAEVSLTSSCFLVTPSEDVLVVYDPSLGFTTGGGWFYWPDGTANPDLAGAKTNFGFTMKYNKKGTSVQGSFLLIAHLPDGSIIRIKSNVINGLAILQNTYPGIASFSGKCVYRRIDAYGNVLVEDGNQNFTVYAMDMDEPGQGTDMFWFNTGLSISGEDPFSLDSDNNSKVEHDEYVPLVGGNIVVPHKGSSSVPEEEQAPPSNPKKK